jgi:hypothetical protein
MNIEEAKAWLIGERSSMNHFYAYSIDNQKAEIQTAQCDAARTEEAYWVARAHKEGLV